jgi:hypothetical protein
MLNVISTAVLVLALLPLSASGQTAPTAAAKPGGPAPTLKRVTGIVGVFIKARDPKALRAWYRDHLGIDVQVWGGTAFR